MENKTHGGKRDGAGRKPLNLEKKMAITLYVPTKDTFPFGNAEKMKEKIYTFISSHNNEVSIQDLTKPTNEIKAFEQPKTNYAVNTPKINPEPITSNFEQYKRRILETTMTSEIIKIMKEVKSDLMTFKEKQNLEAIAKEHSKDFFTD